MEDEDRKKEISLKAIEIIELILDMDYLEKDSFEKALKVSEMVNSKDAESINNKLADFVMNDRATHAWCYFLARIAKRGVTQDRRERMIEIGTRDCPFILNMGLSDILVIITMGVGEKSLQKAAEFILPRGEAFGFAHVQEAYLKILSMGMSIEYIDNQTASMVRGWRYPDLSMAIDVAKTGASISMREALVVEAIKRRQLGSAVAAARIAGRELTEAEIKEIQSEPVTTAP